MPHLHNVEGDELAPQPVRVANGEKPDGAYLVLNVDGGRVGLSGSVELCDVLDAEPVHEPLPDGGLEAVAEHDPDLVGGVLRRLWGGQEEPGNLTDVLRRSDVVLDAVLEEVGRGELLLDDSPVAEREGGAESDLHPRGVVQRQVTVDHVVGSNPGSEVRTDGRVNLPLGSNQN